MKKVKREVKSKGEVIDTVEIPVYESIPEAVKAFGDEAKVLDLINRQAATNAMNAARAAKTRPASKTAALKRLMESDPEVRKKVDKILAELAKG